MRCGTQDDQRPAQNARETSPEYRARQTQTEEAAKDQISAVQDQNAADPKIARPTVGHP